MSANISGVEAAAGLIFREEFRNAALFAANDGTIVGTPTFGEDGLLFPGAGADRISVAFNGRGMFRPARTYVLEFTPGFAKDDGVDRRILLGDVGAGGWFQFRKNLNDQIDVYMDDGLLIRIAIGVWGANWNDFGRNTVVIATESGDTSVWLNNTVVVAGGAAAYDAPDDDHDIYFGARDDGVGACPNTTFHRFEVWQGLADAEDAVALTNGTLLSDILHEKSAVMLPMARDYSNGAEQVTPALGESGITEALMADGATAAEFPTKGLNKRGYEFDGVDDYITIPDDDAFDTGVGAFSMFCVMWSALNWAGTTNRVIMDKSAGTAWGGASDALGYGLGINVTGRLIGVYSGITTFATLRSAVGTLTPGKKHVVGLTYSPANMGRLYIDGVLQAIAATVSGDNDNARDLILGDGSLGSRNFPGGMALPVFDDKEYSPMQVKALTHMLASEVVS